MAQIDMNTGIWRQLPFDGVVINEPWWLLLAIIPLVLMILHLRQKPKVADINYDNQVVMTASLRSNPRWPSHFVTSSLCLMMLLLVLPAIRPSFQIEIEERKALLIWVYDKSQSMETVDVEKNGNNISRLEASVQALEDSLESLPAGVHKLLISFAGEDDIEVGLPTLNDSELISQARRINYGEQTATDFGLERATAVCQQFFNDQQDYPCHIILLSDGQCTPRPQCRLRSEELAEHGADKGIVIHAISWGRADSEYRPNPRDMERIAQIGQGRHLATASTEELVELYNDVGSEVEIQTINQTLATGYVWISRGLIVLLTLVLRIRRLE
ncbi:MAG: VWA domain-containing protein [Candidatus Saccharibacteria bacterium]|nr:VWA domain-containing protein [Candidatus Saccharibacteria bacterium]MCY4088554.1 VWA domain-containing protein [Candidatus Saccharibacteria bacterium]